MDGTDLEGEWLAAQRAMTNADRADLAALGVRPGLSLFLVGIARIRAARGLYEPDEAGRWAYLTPARIESAISPESTCCGQVVRFGALVDLVAWSPARPEAWALRCANAEWLGSIQPQVLGPDAVPIRRSVLSWLRADAVGLVLLTAEPATVYRLLSGCQSGLVAEDAEHARRISAVLRRPWPVPPVAVAGGARRAA